MPIRKQSIKTIAIVASVMLLAMLNTRGAEVNWQKADFAAASALAKQEGKLIHIVVEGENCPPCEAYKATHLKDPAYIDFINSLFVNIKLHEANPADKEFLNQLNLKQPVVPRFYVLDANGAGVSMFMGLIEAPPMEPASVLMNAAGRELPVDKEKAKQVAERLRAHIQSFKAAGGISASNPFRLAGLSALEAQAWALAGKLDEAEKAFGAEWAGQLNPFDLGTWYASFWIGWKRNLPAALKVAEEQYKMTGNSPNSGMLLARAYALNQKWREAVKVGEEVLAARPNDQRLQKAVESWRAQAEKR